MTVTLCSILAVCWVAVGQCPAASEPSSYVNGALNPDQPSGRVALDDYNGVYSPVYPQGLSPVNGFSQPGAPETGIGYKIADPFGPLMRLDRRFGDGPGFESDYTDFNVFVPIHTDPGYGMLFWNLHGIFTDSGDGTGNFGVGYRRYSDYFNRILGASLWLDYDKQNGSYFRGGASFESLGEFCDFRFNSYLVLFDDQDVVNTIMGNNAFFQGNNILINQQQFIEYAYSGLDLEAGGPLPFLGQYGVNGYVGAYYNTADNDDHSLGFQGRLQMLITEDITLGAQITDDDSFGTNAFISVGFTFPTLVPGKMFRNKPTTRRMADPVERRYRVPTRIEETNQGIALINPADGQPFTVVHIDPDETPPPGTGTYENPFASLAIYNDGVNNVPFYDIIYVQPRNDGTGTNLSTPGSLVLQDDQRLLSASVTHQIEATQGTFTIPITSDGIGNPILSSTTNSTVVVLGNRNEIAGFTINGTQTSLGVSGNGIMGVNLNRNTFQNSLVGVQLIDVTGLVANDEAVLIDDNVFTNNFNHGLELENTNVATLELRLSGNTATGNGVNTNGAGFIITADNSTINANDPLGVEPLGILNNTSNNNGSGGVLQTANGGVINANVEGNTFNGNVDFNTGFRATATSGSTINILSFINNTLDGNNGNGALFRAEAAGTINVDDVFDNSFLNNGFAGLAAESDGVGSSMNIRIGEDGELVNTFAGNVIGIDLENIGAELIARIENNQIGTAGNGNLDFGIRMINNQGTVPGANEFDVRIGGPTAADGNMIDSNGIGVAAVFINPDGAAPASDPFLLMQFNTVQNSTSAGASMAAGDDTTPVGRVLDNNISDNGDNGLLVQGNDTSNPLFVIQRNTVSGNQNNGVEVVGNNETDMRVRINDNNQIFENVNNGIAITGLDEAAPRVTVGLPGVPRNQIFDNQNFGVEIFHTTLSDPNVLIQYNDIFNNVNGGVRYAPTGPTQTIAPNPSSTAMITLDNNVISGNGPVGVLVEATGSIGSRNNPWRIFIQNNQIVGHTVDGVTVNLDAGFANNFFEDFPNGPGPAPFPPVTGFYSPNNPQFGGSNYRRNYLNLFTALNGEVQVLNNVISGSGDNGLDLQISTNSHLQALVDGNDFFNNTNSDFTTSSFRAGGVNTNTSINSGTANTDDIVFLDDTAQLQLVFTNNTGRFINPQASGAFFTNNDALKNFDPGDFDPANRPAFLFAVDNTDLTSNVFIPNNGGFQPIENAFDAGNYFTIDFLATFGETWPVSDGFGDFPEGLPHPGVYGIPNYP